MICYGLIWYKIFQIFTEKSSKWMWHKKPQNDHELNRIAFKPRSPGSCFNYISTNHGWMTEWLNVCRTAPATRGLLNRWTQITLIFFSTNMRLCIQKTLKTKIIVAKNYPKLRTKSEMFQSCVSILLGYPEQQSNLISYLKYKHNLF